MERDDWPIPGDVPFRPTSFDILIGDWTRIGYGKGNWAGHIRQHHKKTIIQLIYNTSKCDVTKQIIHTTCSVIK